MFDISNRIDAGCLPGGRTLLNFRHTDLTGHDRWWIKVDGDLSLREARARKRLTVMGPAAILNNLSRRLPLSAFSGIRAGEREEASPG
jgi:hypothetical protein